MLTRGWRLHDLWLGQELHLRHDWLHDLCHLRFTEQVVGVCNVLRWLWLTKEHYTQSPLTTAPKNLALYKVLFHR